MGGDEFMGSFECQLEDLGIFSGGVLTRRQQLCGAFHPR